MEERISDEVVEKKKSIKIRKFWEELVVYFLLI
jgi:hypothetical protein